MSFVIDRISCECLKVKQGGLTTVTIRENESTSLEKFLKDYALMCYVAL